MEKTTRQRLLVFSMTRAENGVLIIIVVAQFLCTSLWFAGNGVLHQLIPLLNISVENLGWMTSAVQFGFIVGTLCYAFLTIADRLDSSSVFLISAFLGAAANIFITLQSNYGGILLFRFLTGFFLAGIYPVGMKIASDHFEKGLGKAMSFLVGALVIGTALPHLIASLNRTFDWKTVIYVTSILAAIGGLLMKLFVGKGPYKKRGEQPKIGAMGMAFKNKSFREAAFGYFGHMWELYAFWAFVPIMLKSVDHLPWDAQYISFQSFLIIGMGSLACFIGGFLSDSFGTRRIATLFLFASGVCCLISPFAFALNENLFYVFMIFWGLVVIADSPLFSTLVTKNVRPEIKGSALTLVTSIGFAVTIVSIELLGYLAQFVEQKYTYLSLAIGPFFGLLALKKP
ncbi:MAG: MFS transporter [Bacteroidota bacterium]